MSQAVQFDKTATSSRPLSSVWGKPSAWLKRLAGKQRLLLIVGCAGLLAMAGLYFWGSSGTATQYMTARVERGDLRNTVTATGTLQAVTTVQVGSQASGTISALYADFNSKVKKGQVIAQLDPSTTQAQVQQARANLDQARAALMQARSGVAQSRAGVSDAQARDMAAKSTSLNQQAGVTGAQANVTVLKAEMDDAQSLLRQQQSLVDAGVVARRDFEVAQTGFKTAEARYNQALAQLNQAKLSEQSSSSAGIAQSQAQVQQAQAQVGTSQASVANAEAQVQQAEAALHLAEINLTHTTIASPIDGIVVSRDVSVGQTVAASLSAPTLFTIANDLTQMQVIANIDQADIGLVEQAKEANFTVDAFPGNGFKGTIEQIRINPQTVQNVVTYNVVINVDNPEQKLKPGMTANLVLTIDKRDNVLKVPNAALRFAPQRSTDQSSRTVSGNSNQGARRRAAQSDGGASGQGATQSGNSGGDNFAPASAPVLPGQTRRVWVMGPDGQPQPRRIKVGLSDGASTEVVDGDLKEGDVVVTGQTLAGSSSSQANRQSAPGFGGAPRGVGGGGAGGSGAGRRQP